MKLSNYPFGSSISLLAIGATGVGKSIACCSFPPPIYVANFDDRMGSVQSYYKSRPALGVNLEDIEFDLFHKFAPFIDKLEELERNCPYRTLIIDPLTVLCHKIVTYSMGFRGKGKTRGKIKFSIPEDYGAEISAVQQMLDSLEIIKNQQKVNTILTAHIVTISYNSANKIKSEDGESTSEQKSERLLVTQGRKLAPQIPLRFDEVYHFFTESSFGSAPEYKIKTFNDGDNIARTSFAGVPGELTWTNGNFYQLMSQYYGNERVETERIGSHEVEESF